MKYIIKHTAGSRLYGTSTENSDYDYRGIFVPDKEFVLTPFHKIMEITDKTEEDTKFYEVGNYIDLYTKANPNIVESLWVPDEYIQYKTEDFDYLKQFNQKLLSSKLAYTYTGYAHNQVKRMDNHHKWIDKQKRGTTTLSLALENSGSTLLDWVTDNFPEHIKEQLAFNRLGTSDEYKQHKLEKMLEIQMLMNRLPKCTQFFSLVHNFTTEHVVDSNFNIMNYAHDHIFIPYSGDIYAIIDMVGCNLFDDEFTTPLIIDEYQQYHRFTPKLIVKFNKTEFNKAKDEHRSYHEWKNNRNKTRALLEESHGYDTKHASHVVRLLRTAEEVLETGVINAVRPDADELLAIRNGAWTYEEIMSYYWDKSDYIRNVLVKKTDLPKKPDIKLATHVLISTYEHNYY